MYRYTVALLLTAFLFSGFCSAELEGPSVGPVKVFTTWEPGKGVANRIVIAFCFAFASSSLTYLLTFPEFGVEEQIPGTKESQPAKRDNGTLTSNWLTAHNTRRQFYGMPPLQWSTKLEASSLAWARSLVNNRCGFTHSRVKYGEVRKNKTNLFQSSLNIFLFYQMFGEMECLDFFLFW